MCMSNLSHKRCKACEGGVSALNKEEVKSFLNKLMEWKADDTDCSYIYRKFEFSSFLENVAFVNAIAWIAHQEDHHPEIKIGYKNCLVKYSTHAINGLSENDFICATKIDGLYSLSLRICDIQST